MADTVIVRKSNRILHVAANLADSYLKRGYDQVNEKGKVVKHATGGKTISVAEFNKLQEAYQELADKQDGDAEEQIKKLNNRIEELENELEETKEKAKKFAERGKDLEEENKRLKKNNK